MTDRAPAPERGKRRRVLILTAAIALVALAVIGAILLLGGDDGPRTASDPGGTISLEYPREGWRELSAEELRARRDRPFLALRREDGTAFVLVRRERRLPGNLREFSRELERQLRQRLDDFIPGRARVVTLRAGRALLYSYARGRAGTANGIVLFPVGGTTYAINTVVRAGSDEAAREVGAIVRSFELLRR